MVDLSTSIRQISFTGLNVYPNPTQGILHIDLNEELSSMRIMSVTGQMVATFNANDRMLDVSNLNPGIYFLELANNKKKSILKIITQ